MNHTMRSVKRAVSAGVIVASTVLGSAKFAQAEENLWIYTRGSDTRPQGSFEAKISDVVRIGKGPGSYVFHDIRPSVEYGVTDRLTVGGSLMIFDHSYQAKAKGNEPMYGDEEGGRQGGKYNHTTLAGFEIGGKYNFLSPYKDAFGLSVGLAYENRDRYRLDGANINQHSYVNTILIQKNWLDDTLTFAFNWKTELERRKSGETLEEEIAFDVSAGISYRFMPKHFAGLEIRRQADYLAPTEGGVRGDTDHQQSNFDLNDMRLGSNHQYGIYLGPTYHYAEKNWWATTGILWQIAGSGSRNSFNRDGKNFDEHERVHLGFTYGYNF